MRKPLIAGNWKMYKTPKESLAFLEAFHPLVEGHTRDEIVLFPTMSSLAYVIEATVDTNVRAGAQNMHWLNEGPYTSQTSPTMLVSIGCRHVLLGHSELRLYFNETYERVNLKLKAAINHGITPIVCVGELLAEREDGQTEPTLRQQVRAALRNISASEAPPPRHRLRTHLGHRHRLHSQPGDRRRGPPHHPPRALAMLRPGHRRQHAHPLRRLRQSRKYRLTHGTGADRRRSRRRRKPRPHGLRRHRPLQVSRFSTPYSPTPYSLLYLTTPACSTGQYTNAALP